MCFVFLLIRRSAPGKPPPRRPKQDRATPLGAGVPMFSMHSTIGVEHRGTRCPTCHLELAQGAETCSRCGSPVSGGELRPFDAELSVAVKAALRERYEIVAEVGRGAHAVVFQAIQVNLERKVALKVLRPHLAGNERFVKRFHQEARAIAQLRHPNIVTIYDEGFAQGIHYMAMEYIEGENLNRLIKRRGRLSTKETVHLAAQIARALDYAHARGLIHRDVKSGNIIMTGEGRAVLMDFGIAHPKSMAVGGSIIGTPEFMSPEQALGKIVDTRTDFYGLGAVIYHALCGRTPYEAGDGLATIRRIAEEPYQRLHEIVAVETWLEEAVDRCLERDRERRISRGGELLEVFARHGMAMAGLTAMSPEIAPPREEAQPSVEDGPETLVPDLEGLQPVPPRKTVALRAAGWALAGGALVGALGLGYLSMNTEESSPLPTEAAVREGPAPLARSDSVSVPSLLGLPLEAAQESLSVHGLATGPVLRALASPDDAGKVFKQLPAPGAAVRRGGKVVLHVGAGE